MDVVVSKFYIDQMYEAYEEMRPAVTKMYWHERLTEEEERLVQVHLTWLCANLANLKREADKQPETKKKFKFWKR